MVTDVAERVVPLSGGFLVGIEDILGIHDVFGLLEVSEDFLAVHLLQPGATDQTVVVFTAERAFVF